MKNFDIRPSGVTVDSWSNRRDRFVNGLFVVVNNMRRFLFYSYDDDKKNKKSV